MPKYHSRAMKQKLVSLFGRMVDVKPVYLYEMYWELTGDSSAAFSETESHINECVRQAIELEDIDATVDLRHHNKGQPTKYDKFWEARETYIHGNIETAVDNQRHGSLTVAISVSDLCVKSAKELTLTLQYHQYSGLGYNFSPRHLQQK